ncbi:MAG: adenine phosphoribosyltransferase [Firmicutes bacterium]|nr:adenine phosphoribosyltransferase [Bacillota bacterium]
MQYTGQQYYDIQVCGLKRRLPVIRVAENLWIASFVMMGDAQLINVCAGGLAARLCAVDFDLMLGPEAKVVPLLQSLATILGHKRYIVCRKSIKAYMQNPLVVDVESITTKGTQKLVLDGVDVERVKGRRIVVVDDVVSTGGTIYAVEHLIRQAGGQIVCRAAVLKEGDFYQEDLIYLEPLPVFSR